MTPHGWRYSNSTKQRQVNLLIIAVLPSLHLHKELMIPRSTYLPWTCQTVCSIADVNAAAAATDDNDDVITVTLAVECSLSTACFIELGYRWVTCEMIHSCCDYCRSSVVFQIYA